LAALSPEKKRQVLIWIIVRFGGLGILTLLLLFSLINPILAGALILSVIIGSSFALRIWAGSSFRGLMSYAIYIGTLVVLAGLWLFSVISPVVIVIIIIPVVVSYLVLSRYGK
jgi:hypothetical protein